MGVGGDLPERHDHARLGGGLAGDLGVGVDGETGVQDRVADLVTHFVRVALGDVLGGEEEGTGHGNGGNVAGGREGKKGRKKRFCFVAFLKKVGEEK